MPLNGLGHVQDDKTKSWKKLVNVAVSGAAGMISNHLLFKVSNLLLSLLVSYLELQYYSVDHSF